MWDKPGPTSFSSHFNIDLKCYWCSHLPVLFFVLKFQCSWSCYHSTFQLSICGKKSLHTFEQINISGAVWVCWFSSSDSHLKFSIHKKTIARYLVWLSTAKSPGGDADLIFFFVLIVFGFCCKTETNSGLWKLVFITAKKKEPITGSSKLLFQNLELHIFKFQLLNELKFWLAINFQFINKVFFSGENKLP